MTISHGPRLRRVSQPKLGLTDTAQAASSGADLGVFLQSELRSRNNRPTWTTFVIKCSYVTMINDILIPSSYQYCHVAGDKFAGQALGAELYLAWAGPPGPQLWTGAGAGVQQQSVTQREAWSDHRHPGADTLLHVTSMWTQAKVLDFG